MKDIPLALRNALESGQCVLFLGAGIGWHMFDLDGNPAPTAAKLSEQMAQHFAIETDDVSDLSKIAQVVEIRHGRTELETFIQKRLANLEPDESLQWLFTLRWRAIFTTNYDSGIQRAYQLIASPPQTPITITATSELVQFDPRFEVPVYHLHGALFGPQKSHIVVTKDDYARFREQRRMLFELLKTEFATSTILYIGYSHRDANWDTVLTELQSEFLPSPMPLSFRVAPNTDLLDQQILKAKNVETLDGKYQDFVDAATRALIQVSVDSDRLNKIKASVPTELIEAFDKNPAPVARLLNSWTYVNQAPFTELPNVREFLRGDLPNWALVAGQHQFERDLEEEVYDELLDYATIRAPKPRAVILLGPAGYGTSTLLMTLATKLVIDRAGAVFMLKVGRQVFEGDVEFAATLTTDRLFFFVDNASDSSEALLSSIERLRNTDKTALFILGDRLNEWRQARRKARGKEFLLEPLSDPEINRLLDCLGAHAELNALEHLTREHQFAVIKEKHGKELLVAMREATEGTSFDAILEGEFRGIADTLSRRLYLTVCCFYQHGAYIRADLLAQLVGYDLQEMYKKTGDATEGVVIYDQIDASYETYAARARHRIVAQVVWERCGDVGEQEQILQSALSALNLNYKVDRDAFEYFIRSDRLVNTIRTLEGKVRFFDKAAQKDPDSPYVRQHYARMLAREGQADLALLQIDEAIKLNPRLRVLHHTRGTVLKQLALTVESIDLARRRMAQSEASFRTGLNLNNRDEYSHQGLAQLYLGWAQRAESEDEVTEYLAKAEGIVNAGLKVVRERDGLWIESSRIHEFLGNEPSRVHALERAVRDSPGSIISRYMLGRAYRKSGRYQDAIEVLEPVIRNHHDEFRAFVEYAVAMVHIGRPYAEATAILKLSTLYGYSDPRFIATLGGMLFMGELFTEAEEVFNESSKRDFSATEVNTVQFRPPDPNALGNPLRIKGKISTVKAGHAFIQSAPYPDFLCPGSKFGGFIMKQDIEVTFEPAFTARRAIADRPKGVNGL